MRRVIPRGLNTELTEPYEEEITFMTVCGSNGYTPAFQKLAIMFVMALYYASENRELKLNLVMIFPVWMLLVKIRGV